jgi:Na+/pantothenate symporter
MTLLLLALAQIAPAAVEIPWWLQLFAFGGLAAVGIWMLLLVRHAAREERDYNAAQAKDKPLR